MLKQLIFVVESTKKANTDGRYIKVLLDHYYIYGRELKISFVCMNGKGNFEKKAIQLNIKTLIRKFNGESHVFYVVDKDRSSSVDDQNLNLRIAQYCEQQNYQCIWFTPNIEQVLLKRKVEQGEKLRYTLSFCNNNLMQIEEKNLRCTTYCRNGTSNVLCVIDKFLESKSKVCV